MSEPRRSIMEIAVQKASESRSESSKKPMVGAIVARGDEIIETASRGELGPGEHAEYTLLEKKCKNISLAGATLYTTLEPCTSRNPPKRPCAEWIIGRKIRDVVIGMLDPNPNILGRGCLTLREAGINIFLFAPDLTARLEELNRDFYRHHRLIQPVHSVRQEEITGSSGLAYDSQGVLGLSASFDASGRATEVRLQSFQFRLTNKSSQPITSINGRVVCNSGKVIDLCLVKPFPSGLIVPCDEMAALPVGNWVIAIAPLSRAPGSQYLEQIPEVQFLKDFTPWSLQLESNLGTSEHHFGREATSDFIRKFLDRGQSESAIWRS